MIVLRLAAATIFPMAVTGILTLLENKTRFSSLRYGIQQTVIGIIYGVVAVLSTEYGVPTGDGVVMNVRDSAPLCAGLIFGAPAGFIAGLIGGAHRWLSVYWGGGMLTRAACSISTFLAGVFSGMMRKRLFEDAKPGFLSGFGIGATMEVLHMLLILATNLADVTHAFSFVQICAFPMIFCNAIAVSLSVLISRFSLKPKKIDIKSKQISYDFGFWLLVCVLIAFFVTSGFTQQIVYRITTDDAVLYRNVTLYLVAFMEILIYTALFILIYQMLKKKVVLNLHRVNDGLSEITNGNLDTVIDVRYYREFSELSDHVNATVATLKRYIKDAEDRIDQELEFARQIQHSSLPSVFPPYPDRPDFDLYASMNAAKEVGGDFYDFFMLNHFNLVFVIADVSGKGVPAAMFMMTAKTLIRGLAESGKNVDEIFAEANQKLCDSNEAGMFITAWIGKLDLRTGILEFVNAGHNPPLLCRKDGEVEYLRTKPNFILAGMKETRYVTRQVQLFPGDEIFLYTDGVTEAADKNENLYGESRLKECLAGVAGKQPQEVCDTVRENVSLFAAAAPQSDDITMLCMRMNARHDKDILETRPDQSSFTIVQTFLDDRLKTANVPAKTHRRMQVAADEIWSNIVGYSNATMAHLKLRREADTLFMDIIDDGVPFDPTQQGAPDTSLSAEERKIGGLGLHMVRNMTSSMQYEYADGQNRLTLGFNID